MVLRCKLSHVMFTLFWHIFFVLHVLYNRLMWQFVASRRTVHTINRCYRYGGATAHNTIYIMQIKNENVARTYKRKQPHTHERTEAHSFGIGDTATRDVAGRVLLLPPLLRWQKIDAECRQGLANKFHTRKFSTNHNNVINDVWFVQLVVDAYRIRF